MPKDGTFTNERRLVRKVKRDLFSLTSIKFSVKIDDRGRIFIPAYVRKTLGLNSRDVVQANISVSEEELRQRRRLLSRCGDEK